MGSHKDPRHKKECVVIIKLRELCVAPVMGSHVSTVQECERVFGVPDLQKGQKANERRSSLPYSGNSTQDTITYAHLNRTVLRTGGTQVSSM